MEDLIPFLIFIVIAIINFSKFLAEKSRKKPPAKPAPEKAGRKPSGLEDFFEEIARKLEPKPTSVPEWPEAIERPDYVKEMEQYTLARTEPETAAPDFDMEPVPVAPLKPNISKAKVLATSTSFKMNSQGTALTSIGSMRIAAPVLLRSATGTTRFDLDSRKQLKQALIANMVFGGPRAYDTTFENTINI